MFIWIVTLLILVIVIVSPFLIARRLSSTLEEELTKVRIRQDRVANRVDQLATDISKASRLIVASQSSLDKKFDALARLADKINTQVTWEYQNFNALAKADVVSARREELYRAKELKVALERLMGVALTSRQPPSPNDVLALENLTQRIAELESILDSYKRFGDTA